MQHSDASGKCKTFYSFRRFKTLKYFLLLFFLIYFFYFFYFSFSCLSLFIVFIYSNHFFIFFIISLLSPYLAFFIPRFFQVLMVLERCCFRDTTDQLSFLPVLVYLNNLNLRHIEKKHIYCFNHRFIDSFSYKIYINQIK